MCVNGKLLDIFVLLVHWKKVPSDSSTECFLQCIVLSLLGATSATTCTFAPSALAIWLKNGLWGSEFPLRLWTH
jgi:hypothetical protein